jgi:hypothetical protein
MTAPAVCEECGKPLTDPVSRKLGIGPKCWLKKYGPSHCAPHVIPAPARAADPDQIPLPLEEIVDAEAAHSLVDRLVDTDPLKLRDALFVVISKLETLAGRSADTDDVIDEIRGALESRLA